MELSQDYIAKLIKDLEEMERKDRYTLTLDYEDWLYNLLRDRHIVSDWDELYLYEKPDGISDLDVKNIFLIHYYWNHMRDEYSTPEPECCRESFSVIEEEHEFRFPVRDMDCMFRRVSGCGCYVHTIEVV